jgi:hypothetical protein
VYAKTFTSIHQTRASRVTLMALASYASQSLSATNAITLKDTKKRLLPQIAHVFVEAHTHLSTVSASYALFLDV